MFDVKNIITAASAAETADKIVTYKMEYITKIVERQLEKVFKEIKQEMYRGNYEVVHELAAIKSNGSSFYEELEIFSQLQFRKNIFEQMEVFLKEQGYAVSGVNNDPPFMVSSYVTPDEQKYKLMKIWWKK